MRSYFLALLLYFLSWTLPAQQPTLNQISIDSLKDIANRARGAKKSDALFELAKYFIDFRQDSSQKYFEQALSFYRLTGNDTSVVRALCQFALVLSNAGKKELALHYLIVAKQIKSTDVQIPHYQVKIYQAFFDVHYWFFNDYDSCVFYAKKWIDASSDSTDRAWGYTELGVSHAELGNNIRALACYHIADTYLQSTRADRWVKHHLYNNLGMLYSDEREFKTAETFFLKGLQYARNSKWPAAGLPELNNLAVLYIWLGDYDKSLKYLAMVAELLRFKKDPWSDANNVLNVGNALTRLGKPEKGAEKYKQAIAMFTKLNEDYKLTSLHRLMAEAYRLQGKYREAEREAVTALAAGNKHNYGDLVKESYQELFKIYGAMHRYGLAFDYQSKYLTIVDSLNSDERRTKFGLVEKNFEIAQQEKVKEKLLHENELHRARAKADQATLVFLIIGTVILATCVVVAVMAFRRSRIQNQKIEEQAQHLRDAAEMKTRFFANVSHELRTPVTLLNGMLELMQENPPQERMVAQIEIAVDNSRRLQRMLNDVLDLSRVEAQKWVLSTKPVHLVPLMNRIVLAFESLMAIKNITLHYDALLVEGLVMHMDEDKFEKIINNLIYNAIKFNHEGGWIKVSAKRTNDTLQINVADSGIGIPEADLPHIFDRFYQGTTRGLHTQGIGIGLSLVREFTELHGGKVMVSSIVNEGSCFIVHLPMIERAITPLENAEDDYPTQDIFFEPFDHKPLVLIVEDNDEMRFYLKEILGRYVALAETRHGVEGLKWLKSNRPDLIISDVMMPEMDGYEFLSQLKNSDAYRDIPMVMLTARSSEEDVLYGLALGVDDYIIKPFNAKELTVRVHNLLVNQKIRAEWKQKPMLAEEVANGPFSEDNVFAQRVKNFVEENAGNSSLGIGDLSDYLAMSERQVYRKAASLTGMTPAQLIKELRLKIAYRLLQGRKVVKVTELAKRVGFDNCAYFSRQFFERYGKRPVDFL